MDTLLPLGFVFISISSLVLIILWLIRSRTVNPTVDRLKEFEDSLMKAETAKREPTTKKEQIKIKERVAKVLSELSRFTKSDEKKLTKQQIALIQAGFQHENSLRVFAGAKVIAALFMGLLFFYIGSFSDKPFTVIVMIAVGVGVFGYRVPDSVLVFMVKKRQNEIAASLPDALDLLVISVEAGLGLNAAMMRVGQDLMLRSPALAQELLRVNQEMRTGVTREQALRNLANRNLVEDLRILVGALVMADKLGTSIANTLRSQSDSLRTRIRQKAEEQAAKAAIKMLLPLVIFILPALILIIMGPALIALLRMFRP
jgi:tight adherence protein C